MVVHAGAGWRLTTPTHHYMAETEFLVPPRGRYEQTRASVRVGCPTTAFTHLSKSESEGEDEGDDGVGECG